MAGTGHKQSFASLSLDRLLTAKSEYSSLVGSLLQCYVDAAGFSRTRQVPFVHLGDHLLNRSRHGVETPLSTAGNGVAALKCDHIAMPVGAFPVGRRLCSLNRYDLVILSHCVTSFSDAPNGKDLERTGCFTEGLHVCLRRSPPAPNRQ